MRITKIKLSGFKSFVDPTTLTLPGNLTGVVGPNGCGKSNIIDALIWVMGETSAKHLRGDMMADVIFNGSNTRKPVGQATVEIIFDNSDGTIGGQYAGFGEIVIKRAMGRDGISSYFLNGTRCRRKDITNVFLGTGIRARGYSVIEQGMISRVVEARPEELRGFLEEAAGISKYKERRRETENRMRRANENIERLNDIRDELEKQLAHLQRQARAAERFQHLKLEQRALEAKMLAVRWRTIDGDSTIVKQLAEARHSELEAQVSELRGVESKQTALHTSQGAASDEFNRVQSDFYGKSAEISRLEQGIKHAEEREQSLRSDLGVARTALTETARLRALDEHKLAEIDTTLGALEPDGERLSTTEQRAAEAVQAVEARFEQWRGEWDEFNHSLAAATRAEHAAQIRLEHVLEDRADADTRAAHLNQEASGIETAALTTHIERVAEQIEMLERTQERATAERNAARANLTQNRGAVQALSVALHERQSELETQRGRLASLHALQEAAYGSDQETLETWLRAQGIENLTRLAAVIEIEPGWEDAVENALRIPLGAVCGKAITVRLLSAERSGLELAQVTAIDTAMAGARARAPAALPELVAKISGGPDLAPLLTGVYAAEDLAQARALQPRLGVHEMVALQDGTLLGSNWVQLAGALQEDTGILAREGVIQTLAATIEKAEDDSANARAQVTSAQARMQAAEQREHELGIELEQCAQRLSTQRTELGRVTAEYERRKRRATDVATELEQVLERAEDYQASIDDFTRDLKLTEAVIAEHETRKLGLSAQRREIQTALDDSREQWRAAREHAHQTALRLEQQRAEGASLREALQRNGTTKEQLQRRCADIEVAISQAKSPQNNMRGELEQALSARLAAENQLSAARQALDELDHQHQQLATRRLEIDREIEERQKRLEQVRLDQRALEVRAQELMGRFAQTGVTFEDACASVGADDSEDSVQQEVDRIGNRITRLGPINLAAIDEFKQRSERKDYLDRQHQDLTDALATLQDAMRKIDRETRTRFKETYDKVNNGLQTIFPVLFGGGHAYLELTGDDLLETGVTVMARPPGKRNSTINLLSGGEKALTAVAFVFAIFELNPAPFCLLDEVDAPLDDANIVRLTDMLSAMARNVQFLMVTHNKITMEIAQQLIGVTMQEAGVSRLVSVNMEEAVEMAATA